MQREHRICSSTSVSRPWRTTRNFYRPIRLRNRRSPAAPLGFSSKKLSSAETKYGAFDRELSVIYRVIRKFRHMVDHSPQTPHFRFSPESRKMLIRYISGKDNIVAESRIMIVSKGIDFQDLALLQAHDEELQTYLHPNSSLNLTRVPIPETDLSIYCDVFLKIARPFIILLFNMQLSPSFRLYTNLLLFE